jgi:hypothetical protein
MGSVALSPSTERGIPTEHNYYFRLVSGLVPRPLSVGASGSDRSTQHNPIFGFWWKEPAPRNVVAPAASRRPAAAVEAQPPLHVCFGNPHPLTPSVLSEHHDVGHALSVAPRSIR